MTSYPTYPIPYPTLPYPTLPYLPTLTLHNTTQTTQTTQTTRTTRTAPHGILSGPDSLWKRVSNGKNHTNQPGNYLHAVTLNYT